MHHPTQTHLRCLVITDEHLKLKMKKFLLFFYVQLYLVQFSDIQFGYVKQVIKHQ